MIRRFEWFISVVAAVLVAAIAVHQLAQGRRLLTTPGFFDALAARGTVVVLALCFAGAAWCCWVIAERRVGAFSASVVGVSALAVVVIAVLSGTAWSLVLAIASIATWWAAGDAVLAALGAVRWPAGTAPVIALALGVTVCSLLWLFLGLAHALFPWLAALVLAGGTARAGLRLRGPVSAELRRRSGGDRLGALAACLVALMSAAAAVWTAAPEIQYDAVYGKVWLPQIWAADGSIWFSTEHPVTAMFGTGYLAPVPGHLLGGPDIGRWLQWSLVLVVVVAVYRRMRIESPVVASVSAVLLAVTPHVIWQASTANDDVLLLLLVLAAALAVIDIGPRPTVVASFVVGLTAGATLAGKMHIAAFAVVLVLAWLWTVRRADGVWRHVVAAVGGSVLLGAPILVARWVATGNPVFPQLNNVFKSASWPPVNETFNLPYLADGSIGSLITMPWKAIATPSDLMEAVPPGVFGALIVPTFIGPVLGIIRGRVERVVGIALLVSLAVWWQQLRYLRYLLPYSVIGMVLVGIALGQVLRSGRRQWRSSAAVLVTVASVASLPSVMAAFWNIPDRFPIDVAIGAVSEADYLATALPAAGISKAIDTVANPGDLVVGEAYVRTMLSDGIDSTPPWEFASRRVVGRVVDPTDPDAVLAAWRELGASHLAVYADRRTAGGYPLEMLTLLAARAQLVWSNGSAEVYELTDQPIGDEAVLSCADLVGSDGCWPDVPLDDTPGIDAAEAPNGVHSFFDVCVGDLYTLEVDVTGAGPTTLYLVGRSDGAELTQYTQHDVGAGVNRVAVTVFPGTTRLEVAVRPTGDGVVDTVRVGRTEGDDCAAL